MRHTAFEDGSRASSFPTGVTARDAARAACLVVLLVHAGLRAWAVFGGWFYSDDLLLLERVSTGPLDAHMLLAPHDSQIMPVGIALTWLATQFGVYSWTAAASILWALQVAGAVSCWWMLRELFGERLGIVAPLALFCFSTMAADTTMWWAAALNALPMQIAFFWLVVFVVRWSRATSAPGRAWSIVGAAAAFALAVLSGPRGFVMAVPVAVLVLVFLLPWSGGWRTVARRVRGLLVLVGPLAVVGAGWLIYYWTHAPAPVQTSGDAPARRIAVDLLTASWAPSLVGGPWRWSLAADPLSLPHPPVVLRVVAGVVVLVWAVLAVRRDRRAGFGAIALVASQLAVTYIAIVYGRGTQAGALAAIVTRYLADALPVTVLALALSLMRLERRDATAMPPPRRVLPVAAVVGVAVCSAIVSLVGYVQPWHRDFPTREWVANAAAELRADPGPVANVEVPGLVQLEIRFPQNRPSHILAPYGDLVDARLNGNDLRAFDEHGRLHPAVVQDTASAPPGPVRGCGYRVRTRPVTIAVDRGTMTVAPWTSIGYLSSTGGDVDIDFGHGHVHRARLQPGAHTYILRGNGAYDTVTITPRDHDGTVCVDRVDAGELVPFG